METQNTCLFTGSMEGEGERMVFDGLREREGETKVVNGYFKMQH